MNLIENIEVVCPYCGETFSLEADTEAGSHTITEDCSICCRPIALKIQCQPGRVEGITVEPG